jgi:hypothetical protein
MLQTFYIRMNTLLSLSNKQLYYQLYELKFYLLSTKHAASFKRTSSGVTCTDLLQHKHLARSYTIIPLTENHNEFHISVYNIKIALIVPINTSRIHLTIKMQCFVILKF